MNTYRLAYRDQTTGWDASSNEVNELNEYRMRPIEVAAQAGNVEEFHAIVNHPAFDPIGARTFFFAEIGRNSGDYDAEKRYSALIPELRAYRERFMSQHA